MGHGQELAAAEMQQAGRGPRIGAHVPVAGGLLKGVANAVAASCETFQIFVSNPRGWAMPEPDPSEDREFRARAAAAGLDPLFVHAPYLVNLASPSDEVYEKSVRALAYQMKRSRELGAAGLVVHTGAEAGGGDRRAAMAKAREALLRLLSREPGPLLLLELTAGGAGTLAATLPEARELLELLDGHPRVGFCLDTCHLFAAGYELRTPGAINALAEEVEREVGWERVHLIHANDSRDPLGSRRDRHWHIGEGEIGREAFRLLVNHPAFSRLPLIVETPGDVPDHRKNVETLRSLWKQASQS